VTISKPMTSRLSSTFLIAALLFLLAGLFLFIFADSVATLPANTHAANAWPWPIGPLALRFVASLLLAGALASFLAFRRPDRPTVAVFATVAAIFSGALLLHALVNLGNMDWAKPLSYIWLIVLVLGFIGSGAYLVMLRARPADPTTPSPATPGVSRSIALGIFILTGLVGVIMFLLPDFARERWPWDLINSTNVQLLGAVFISVSLSSLLTWLQPSWYGYDIFFPVAGTFAVIALVACFIHWNLFSAHPITSWIFVAVYILGAIMGFYPYFRYVLSPNNRS
jgi:hypothetical protein